MMDESWNKKVAVIDLGTNTAHILIATITNNKLNVVHKKRFYTFLAENGIEKISEEAIDRLFSALTEFKSICTHHCITKVKVTGTEAFRKANNGRDITDRIVSEFGWGVEIISGDQEADLIYKGVKEAVPISQGNYLIMDIGGGSVEFIITSESKAIWRQSFPIGIAKIYNGPHMREELSLEDIRLIKSDIIKVLSPLVKEIKKYNPLTLVGAAGSFEILTKEIIKNHGEIHCEISKMDFLKLMDEVIHLSPTERAKVSWIPEERAQYVTAAIILIQIAAEMCRGDKILISLYALKEGLASEMLIHT